MTLCAKRLLGCWHNGTQVSSLFCICQLTRNNHLPFCHHSNKHSVLPFLSGLYVIFSNFLKPKKECIYIINTCCKFLTLKIRRKIISCTAANFRDHLEGDCKKVAMHNSCNFSSSFHCLSLQWIVEFVLCELRQSIKTITHLQK